MYVQEKEEYIRKETARWYRLVPFHSIHLFFSSSVSSTDEGDTGKEKERDDKESSSSI